MVSLFSIAVIVIESRKTLKTKLNLFPKIEKFSFLLEIS